MMFGTKEEFLYSQCSVCGSLQLIDVPKNMAKYYKDGYYSVDNRLHLTEPKKVFDKIRRIFINKRNSYAVFNRGIIGRILYKVQPNTELASLSKIKLTKETSILDVGCGVGAHLYFIKELGFKNILGLDPYNSRDIIHDNGLKISNKNIFQINTKWDVITYHHSFEHIEFPISELNRVYELLNQSGTCIIRTPTVDSYAWQNYKENWIQIDAPRHYFIYSLEGIRRIALQTGFELYSYYYDSEAFQFWGSEQYQSGIPLVDEKSYHINPGNSIFSNKEINNFCKKANKLNKEHLGDQAVYYLRKL